MTTGSATTKIIIVSGQEFSVPADTDNEQIREHLKSNGFPDVAAATIQTGTRTVEGQEVQTIEFVKRAGTKGLGDAELAELLATVPPAPLDAGGRLSHDHATLIRRLTAGLLTFGQALADVDALDDALQSVYMGQTYQSKENELCERVDRVPAVPCAIPLAW